MSVGPRKKMVFVGGLDPAVNEEVLHAAFIPFGVIKEVHIPRDFQKNQHRGFGFVDFEEPDDADDAIDNMDGAELFGKPIKVSFAKPLTKVDHGKAIWTSEEWIQAHIHDEGTAEPVQG